MAFIISKEVIEHYENFQHYKNISVEAKNLVQVVENYLNGKTTRSQLNKALKKVKYLTSKELL